MATVALALATLACSAGGSTGVAASHHSPGPSPRPTATVVVATPPAATPGGNRSVSLPPTPATAAISTDLVFSGTISGQARGEQVPGRCGAMPGGFDVQVPVALAGTSFVLQIQILDYRGPGRFSIPPERVSIHPSGSGSPGPFMPATSGTVDVDPGQRSGRIDATLTDQAGITTVKGTWSCS